MTKTKFDFCVVGAGIAGASIAAELAAHASVAVLEMEGAPGYHATGRSAAFWTESYGGPGVQPLTTASGPWFEERGLVTSRGALTIGPASASEEIDDFARKFAELGVRVERLGADQMQELVPGLRDSWSEGAYESDCKDIDVAGVHAAYVTALKKCGARLLCRAEVLSAQHGPDGWLLESAGGRSLRCAVLVNAAGAWADSVAQRSGVATLGITPMRRTVVQLDSNPAPPTAMPLVIDVAEQFYFKPESGRVWLSPHDETPCEPCDAAPEELDIALAVDRFESVVDWNINTIERKWAGLRSFSPDRLPIYGEEPDNPAFFWFAGQGGVGIQTAPAAARLAAQLLLDHPRDGLTERLDPALYSPARFR